MLRVYLSIHKYIWPLQLYDSLHKKLQLVLIWGGLGNLGGDHQKYPNQKWRLTRVFQVSLKMWRFFQGKTACVSYYCFSLMRKDFIMLSPVLSSSEVYQEPSVLLHWHLVGFDQACNLDGLLILRSQCLIIYLFILILPRYSCWLQKSSINIHWALLNFFLDVWHSFNQGVLWKDSLPNQGQ